MRIRLLRDSGLTVSACRTVADVHWLRRHFLTRKIDVSFTLLSLDPTIYLDGDPKPSGEMFHGHTVLGQLQVDSVETQARLLDALQVGFEQGDGVAKCLWPRHGVRMIRAGLTTDYCRKS